MIQLAMALYIVAAPCAAFDYRENSPGAPGPQVQAACDATLPEGVSNPAYLPLFRYPYIIFSGSKPYTLEELYSSIMRIGYGIGGFGLQAGWNRFGFDQYLENTVELTFGYMPVRYVSLGLGIFYHNIMMRSSEISFTSHLVDGSLSLLISPCRWIDFSFLYENIGSLFFRRQRDLLSPGWSAGAALKPARGCSIVWNINRTPYGYVNTLSASANVLKYLSLRAGYSPESSSFSAAVIFSYKYVSASYGLKYHPHLGFTHSVGITLSPQEIPVESLNYNAFIDRLGGSRDIKKIDIASCTPEELGKIPDLSQTHARRIMQYRETVGPVTRNSLAEIGMSDDEIYSLCGNITGLGAIPERPRAARHAAGGSEQAKKVLFGKLLRLGLNPSLALELAEMAATGRMDRIRRRITETSSIDKSTGSRVMELCAGSR